MRAALPLLAVLLAGCASAPEPPPPPAYRVPVEAPRPDEVVLGVPTTSDGDTAFTLLGLTTGLDVVIGSHAEWRAKGRFARVRMIVVNTGRSSVLFDARRHVLVDERGGEHPQDAQAMTIKRQPERVDLGAGVRLEYDAYFDVPEGARPVALRAFGGPTLTDLQDLEGTEIRFG